MKIKSLLDLPSVYKYLTRIGAEARSMKTAVVKEISGSYWKDVAVIRFSKNGEISCTSQECSPTSLEEQAIKDELIKADWPVLKPLHRIVNAPKMISEADPKNIFEFRDASNQIVMVQVRVDVKGGKAYVPWTYWDDDEWRCCEPDGPLPLFNAHKLKDASTVFIHEGAKAAKHVQWLIDAETFPAKKALASHPWGAELQSAVHLGWIGGAMSPLRTDWSIILKAGIKRVYIVADNDEPGKAVVPIIAQQLRIPTFMIQFTDEFTTSFDLADAFPDAMFGDTEGVRHYIGPSFRDCLHPATWATDLIPNPKGKPTAVLRDSFKEMWAYVEEADLFVCTEMPEIMRAESILNKMLAPFSHAQETTKLIVKAYRGRSTRVCYRPDHSGLLVTFRGSSAINLHVPGQIRAKEGNPEKWLEFLNYMFVNAEERKQVERWCATMIARPDVRMAFGMLLVSERQGIGKTTLGAHILAPLVGYQNVGFPSETDISNSVFNEWMANKRLVIVNEIYSGASWKAYHSLKSVITDRDVSVNQKYMRPYTIENWCHVLACSNSMRALKMENDDRRWFYPEITEIAWEARKFNELRGWIESGGLSVIKHWAEQYGDYVKPSERAPMTERKREMIEGSRSEAQREAAALAEALKDAGKPASLTIKEVVEWVRGSVQGRVFDSDYELRKVMTEIGVRVYPLRVKIHGRMQNVMINDLLADALSRMEGTSTEEFARIREALVKPSDLLEPAI
jgi:hypothetical protein